MIEPFEHTLEVFVQRQESSLVLTGIYEAGQEFASPTLEGLTFIVGRLFED